MNLVALRFYPSGGPPTLGRAMASPADLERVGRASLMDLYRRWESQQWAVSDIDFTLDRQDWIDASEGDRKATLWSHRLFFNGEERVTATLAPFVWASPTPEIEIFLSTQMVDEA